jgi:hypothetical protein
MHFLNDTRKTNTQSQCQPKHIYSVSVVTIRALISRFIGTIGTPRGIIPRVIVIIGPLRPVSLAGIQHVRQGSLFGSLDGEVPDVLDADPHFGVGAVVAGYKNY